MLFDIVDNIHDRLGSGDDSIAMEELDKPDGVTAGRVTDELERALANGDLSVERSGFDDRSALLGSVDPVVRDYHEYYESLDLFNQFEAMWESDEHRTYAAAVDDRVDDDVVEAVERRKPEVVSILKGFGSADTVEWIRDFAERYPAVGCLVNFVHAESKLEEHGYLE
ncbi:hypothetical protein [Haloplanus salilacus]|uniref:hypothetical protein n=1 Tax=Haloplanus salilacus TaxID=2949994 RepID=UPI0030D3008D